MTDRALPVIDIDSHFLLVLICRRDWHPRWITPTSHATRGTVCKTRLDHHLNLCSLFGWLKNMLLVSEGPDRGYGLRLGFEVCWGVTLKKVCTKKIRETSLPGKKLTENNWGSGQTCYWECQSPLFPISSRQIVQIRNACERCAGRPEINRVEYEVWFIGSFSLT